MNAELAEKVARAIKWAEFARRNGILEDLKEIVS